MHRPTIIAGVLLIGALQQPVIAQSRESREHLQLIADLRMLQEQQQRLQATVNQLIETLKTTNANLAAQSADTTKGFAGVRSEIASLNNVLPQLRSLLEQTRVDVGRVGPEIDALREALRISLKYSAQIIEMLTPVDPLAVPNPAATGGTPAPATAPPVAAATMPDSPTTYLTAGTGFYASGDYKSAIEAFTEFLKLAPNAADAAFAQMQVGHSHAQMNNPKEALAAFKVVTEKYRTSDQVPDAYYYQGMMYERLNQTANARLVYTLASTQYKGTVAAIRSDERLKAIK